MYGIDEARERLEKLDRPAGAAARDLTLGIARIRFEGLTPTSAAILDERWGGFLGPPAATAPDIVVRSVRGDGSAWLPPWVPGEGYRIEASATDGPLLVRSYHFALVPEAVGGWRLAIEDTGAEPLGRVLDNAARYLVARAALNRGGLALHGAGVRRAGAAWVFAGPSGAGKSTAVRLSAAAVSLGDDFAVLVPEGERWATCALPFDNSERAPRDPVRGLVGLARVCRLFQGPRHRLERPEGVIAQASLLACTAFPWAIPDAAERAGEAIARLASSGMFAHLHFAPDPGFWELLDAGA